MASTDIDGAMKDRGSCVTAPRWGGVFRKKNRLDSRAEMTRAAISVVDRARFQTAFLMRGRTCCALGSLLCAPVCATSQDAERHSDNGTFNARKVLQRHVDPHRVILPI